MAERIEYQGDALPSGLPGFGNASVSVLTLPGFNTVVAAQKFGPVVEAVNVTPPDPTPPPGSNPEDPTDDVVPPAPAPRPGGIQPSFCKRCGDAVYINDVQPLVYGALDEDYCIDCDGKETVVQSYAPTPAMSSTYEYMYYSSPSGIGYSHDTTDDWFMDRDGLTFNKPLAKVKIGDDEFTDGAKLDKEKVMLSGTEYRKGAKIFDIDTGRTYEPQQLEVCNNGQPQTWYVLAHIQG